MPNQLPSSRRRRRWCVLGGVAVGAWLATGAVAAHFATAAVPAAIPAPDAALGAVEEVDTRTVDGVTVRGWFVRGREPATCVVLAAGVRGNRTRMQGRASFWLARGSSVLLVDLRGTGASDPARIAMGWHEALDLCAWHAFLRDRGVASIGVHGQSLGAAAAVFTAVRGAPEWEFVVLEACYTNVREALAARLPWLPSGLLWPMVASAEWLLDVDVDELDAERAITRLTAPTLFVQGDLDTKVGPNAKDRLFTACSASRKARCDVPKAGHVDLWAAGGRVQAAITAFLHPR
ncbi:MAG: alpha/beta hydrolase [Planctomycetes bacterium]|nr:alpha/beta hydrolase [Planctomycetota bacterium]